MVFGLFNKDKALQRTIERATNKLAQQADRFGALEKLRDDGTEEALFGLCKRWGITATVGVQDEQEKAWVVDVMIEKGAAALAPMRRYMKSSTQLAYPLKALGEIVEKQRALELVDELLADEPPGYTRDPERRKDILHWLGEWKGVTSEDVVPRLVPYLADFDENVRWSTADSLAHHDLAQVGPHLVRAFVRPEEESGRYRRRLAEILSEHKVPLGEYAAQVPPLLVGPVANFAVKDGVLVAR
ncbi:MAG: HEAT repeat domain-containing protein [Deltaproteobacteria bacterium]|nr:HEAT repeat domain-containing protein [Deltaproteobacteria bacterium]